MFAKLIFFQYPSQKHMTSVHGLILFPKIRRNAWHGKKNKNFVGL